MTARVHASRGGHHHLAWEAQPLVGPLRRPRRYGVRTLVLVALVAFLAGVLVG